MERQGFVYIMASRQNGVLYTGVTSDLVKRVYEHKQGITKGFTDRYHVKRLVYFEMFERIDTAIEREKQIKGWNRAWKVKLIEENNQEWVDLYDAICR